MVIGCAAALVAASCTDEATVQSGGRSPVSIAAAAGLRYALDDLISAFVEQTPGGAEVSVSYGSSGSLYAQLVNGAPFDLFLSSDVEYPHRLVEQGGAAPDGLFVYATGRLAIWAPSGSPAAVDVREFDALTNLAVTRVAVANPEHAPYGRAALEAMQWAGVFEVVAPKLVYGENVSQALQFVQSGAAEVGIVALSLAAAPPVVASGGRYWRVPAEAHGAIEQAGVIMRTATDRPLVARFREFMLGNEARALLGRYGFVVPEA